MMQNLSITDHLVYSTVRIECDFANGAQGTGTGFFMNLCITGEQAVPVIVTNRHVVHGSTVGHFVLTLRNDAGLPDVGKHKRFTIEKFGDAWIYHRELDLAIMPIGPLLNAAAEIGEQFFYTPLNKDVIPDDEQLNDLPALQDIVMVGYPNGLWDEINNQPLLRKGVTATHPALPYNGKPEFVIDAACFNGSSGSPVFIVDIGKVTSRSQGTTIGQSRFFLLGVLYAGPQHTATGEIISVEIGDRKNLAVMRIPNNLGFVIRASALLDFEAHINHLLVSGRKPARNEACPCGSGTRYKACCGRLA